MKVVMLEVNFKDSRGDWSATLPLTQHIGFSSNLKSSICFLLQPTSLQHTHKYLQVPVHMCSNDKRRHDWHTLRQRSRSRKIYVAWSSNQRQNSHCRRQVSIARLQVPSRYLHVVHMTPGTYTATISSHTSSSSVACSRLQR